MSYVLADVKKKTYYVLGRFDAWDQFNEFELLKDPTLLVCFMREYVYPLKNYMNKTEWRENFGRIEAIADELIEQFGNSNICDLRKTHTANDAFAVMRAKNYECVGTYRYAKGSYGYAGEIKQMNAYMNNADYAHELERIFKNNELWSQY